MFILNFFKNNKNKLLRVTVFPPEGVTVALDTAVTVTGTTTGVTALVSTYPKFFIIIIGTDDPATN